MADNILQSIFVSLGMQVDKKSFDKAASQLTDFKGALKKFGVGLSFAATGAYILHTVRSLADMSDALDDNSKRVGISAGRLQELQFAFKRNGVEAESLNQALIILARTSAEASANVTGDTAKAFKRLGIHLKDARGHLRTTADLIPEIDAAMSKIPSSTEKGALAMHLFGKSGAQLLSALGQGDGELAKAAQRFRDIGGAFSPGFIERSSKFNDALDDMRAAWRGFQAALADKALPALTKFVDRVTDLIVQFREVDRRSGVVVDALQAIGIVAAIAFAPALVSIALWLALIGAAILLWNDFKVFLRGGDSLFGDLLEQSPEFRASLDKILSVAIKIGQAFRDMWASFEEPWRSPTFQAIIQTLTALLPKIPGISGSGMATQNAIDTYQMGIQKKLTTGNNIMGAALGLPVSESGQLPIITPYMTPPYQPMAPQTSVNLTIAEGAISVQGSSDPAATSDAILSQLQSALAEHAAETFSALTPLYSGAQ